MPECDVHESTSSPFAPDALLPTQYFDRIRRRKDFTGEQRLMISIIELAVDDYMKYAGFRDRSPHELFAAAEAWIESADRSWLYSFETICDHLGLDAGCVRNGLRRWKARLRREVVPAVDIVVPATERRRASNE